MFLSCEVDILYSSSYIWLDTGVHLTGYKNILYITNNPHNKLLTSLFLFVCNDTILWSFFALNNLHERIRMNTCMQTCYSPQLKGLSLSMSVKSSLF